MHGILNDNDFADFDIVLFQEPWYGQIGLEQSSSAVGSTPIYGSVANLAWTSHLPSGATPSKPA
jgi:hypothetical protein